MLEYNISIHPQLKRSYYLLPFLPSSGTPFHAINMISIKLVTAGPLLEPFIDRLAPARSFIGYSLLFLQARCVDTRCLRTISENI